MSTCLQCHVPLNEPHLAWCVEGHCGITALPLRECPPGHQCVPSVFLGPRESTGQPLPTYTAGVTGAHDRAIQLLEGRKRLGMNRYGSPLQPRNGRDSLQDGIDEVMDLFVYLINVKSERDGDMLYGAVPEPLLVQAEKLVDAYTTQRETPLAYSFAPELARVLHALITHIRKVTDEPQI